MKLKSFEDMNCSLAQTLEVVGERWTLLILRDAFRGVRRFDAFQSSLGISRNILAVRLERLVAEDILEKRPVEAGRHEYVLTSKGLDLQPALVALTHWGDQYRPNPRGDRLVFVERASGEPIAPMSVRSSDGRALTAREVRAVPGPGASAAS
ncbi:MAG: helix-turn-helix domain-containing protein [Chloroflexi bacterium]|nr:helix-turn-helix domain-containing protein [Chloroflexota bacterium]MDA1145747.1 helix-turn-helix domain-containing protein [Chloroflexota bacterium]